MTKILKISMITVLFGGFLLQPVLAKDAKSTGKTASTAASTTNPMDAQMAEMMKLGQPSEGHKQLEPLVGKWEYTATMWMDPKQKPQIMKGKAENSMILGGRFLQQKAHGEAQKGQPAFEGIGYTGYDNIKAEYNTTWIDNMSTGMMKGTSSFDLKTKAFNEDGTFTCPIAKDTLPYRAKWTLQGKDAYKYEMFVNDPDGKEYKSMEIAYKRVK